MTGTAAERMSGSPFHVRSPLPDQFQIFLELMHRCHVIPNMLQALMFFFPSMVCVF